MLRSSLTFGHSLIFVLAILASFPFIMPPSYTLLMLEGLVFGIAALGFNMLYRYTGVLSFGQATFFGMGIYTVALMMKAVYLPFPVTYMEIILVSAIFVTGLIGAVFGFLSVRHTRIYFSILTLALSQVVWGLAITSSDTTWSRGVPVGRPDLVGISFKGLGIIGFQSQVYYYYVLVAFTFATFFMWRIVNSPFGKSLQAIRDSENRARLVGLNVRLYRWIAFIIAAVYTGVAGALYAPQVGAALPSFLNWDVSIEIVLMTILGGYDSFAGPIFGAILFTFLESYSALAFTRFYPLYHLLIFSMVLGLALALPSGILGGVATLFSKLGKVAKGKS